MGWQTSSSLTGGPCAVARRRCCQRAFSVQWLSPFQLGKACPQDSSQLGARILSFRWGLLPRFALAPGRNHQFTGPNTPHPLPSHARVLRKALGRAGAGAPRSRVQLGAFITYRHSRIVHELRALLRKSAASVPAREVEVLGWSCTDGTRAASRKRYANVTIRHPCTDKHMFARAVPDGAALRFDAAHAARLLCAARQHTAEQQPAPARWAGLCVRSGSHPAVARSNSLWEALRASWGSRAIPPDADRRFVLDLEYRDIALIFVASRRGRLD